jgi:hypothetical protein
VVVKLSDGFSYRPGKAIPFDSYSSCFFTASELPVGRLLEIEERIGAVGHYPPITLLDQSLEVSVRGVR